MDEMTLLRRFRDDLPEADDARMQAIRDRLDARMSEAGDRRRKSTPGVPVRSRRFVVGGLGAVVAAGLVVAAVTTGPAPRASAEVTRLLTTAADTAHRQTTTGASRSVTVRLEGLGEQLGTDGEVIAAYNTRTVQTTEVPVGDGVWTRSSYTLAPDAFYGGAAARALAARERTTGAGSSPTDPLVTRSDDGDFTNGELGGGSIFGDDPAAIRALPRDPARMLESLRSVDLGVGQDGGAAHVLAAASVVLNSGVADGRLQATVFQALRLQSGLVVGDRPVRLASGSGVVVEEADPSSGFTAPQLVLDPRSGRYLGAREVALRAQGVIPVGTTVSSVTVIAQ